MEILLAKDLKILIFIDIVEYPVEKFKDRLIIRY